MFYHNMKNSDEERKIKTMIEEQEKRIIAALSTKRYNR